MLKRIHVNRHHIKHNTKHGSKEKPVVTVSTYKNTERGFGARIEGPCKIIYRPEKPLKCGATLWIETEAEVEIT